jgi:16S rRNA (guanine966-N2)-methyltransferase
VLSELGLSQSGDLDGIRVMDLYAGSGAVGLEALSRGADSVLLVESDARAASVIRANVKAVAMSGATVAQDRVERLLALPGTQRGQHGGEAYDLVFADPPYAVTDAEVRKVLTYLADGWLAPDALIVVERATRSGPFRWPPGYVHRKSRGYGEATFWYGSYTTTRDQHTEQHMRSDTA